jgi:hypothetical protein
MGIEIASERPLPVMKRVYDIAERTGDYWLRNGRGKRDSRGRLFRRIGADDQPIAFIKGEIVPDPVGKDEELIPEADEVVDVYEQPDPPGEAAAEIQFLWQVCDGMAAADGCQGAFVKIMEGFGIFIADVAHEVVTDIFPHLDGYLRHAGMALGIVFGFHDGDVADGKDIGTANDATVFVDDDPSLFYPFRMQARYCIPLHSRGPDNRIGIDGKLIFQGELATVIGLDHGIEGDGDPHFFQIAFGPCAGLLRHGR